MGNTVVFICGQHKFRHSSDLAEVKFTCLQFFVIFLHLPSIFLLSYDGSLCMKLRITMVTAQNGLVLGVLYIPCVDAWSALLGNGF